MKTRRGRETWLSVVLFAALVLPPSARGDGKVFPPQAFPAEVRIPDQSAILIWSNGVERLVIETRFKGKGTNFAWVVPLPSVPVIEPATTGVFTTLRHIFRPEIRHALDPIWAGALFLGALLWLLLTVRAHQPGLVLDVITCALAAVGAGVATRSWLVALGILGPALFATYQSRRGREPIYTIPLTVGLVGVVAAMLLPALAKSGAGATTVSPAAAIEVLDQRRVGVYETTTVAARDPAALPRWLETNGFSLTAGSRPVIEQYAREGWVFVAAKAQRDVLEGGPSALHPLSFTFVTTNPIYPLRLTAVGSDRVSIDLYVFGPGRAAARGFQATDCQRPAWPSRDGRGRASDQMPIRHPAMAAWAAHTAVATKLSGSLDTADMRQDSVISWQEFQPARTRLYSTHGAWVFGLNWGVPMAAAILLVGAARNRIQKQRAPVAGHVALAALILGAAITGGVALSRPHISVRLARHPAARSMLNIRLLAAETENQLGTNQPTLANVRQAIARALSGSSDWKPENVILGGTIREEDSPGNFILRETSEGVQLLEYGWWGEEDVDHVFRFKRN